jgi:N-methylhydantoinase B
MSAVEQQEIHVFRAKETTGSGAEDADPITTEVIRHALNSAANQMKWSLVRTSFSPVIYEVLDFAVAIYDSRVRLLAQAPALPLFLGTMSFCVEEAVKGVGGVEKLEEGDVILYNWPYGIGSHAQDAALVMPSFAQGELVGYTAIKAHWLDLGAKAPYCTDTTDVFQEGTFFPGVKLCRRGEYVDDIYRIVLANSRMPKILAGDLSAQVTGVQVGAAALTQIVDRYGLEVFGRSIERMYDHGERVVRKRFAELPDGRYSASTILDNDGVNSDPIEYEVTVEVDGDTVRVDFTNAPDALGGPMNAPIAATVSATRLALTLFAGGGGTPNDGMHRPIEVITRPGSMFHPLPPAPCFLYAWPVTHGVDVIYRALAQAVPDQVPACQGGDILGLISWGIDPRTGDPWGDGTPHPSGQGAHANGDGPSALNHFGFGNGRVPPAEVYETKTTWMITKEELAPDSCGAGKYRGGLGVDKHFLSVDDSTWATPAIERTIDPPWGLFDGEPARPNLGTLHRADGTTLEASKATVHVPAGASFVIQTGGGGGYGPASERDPAAVLEDLANGYITEEHARRYYPHAFEGAADKDLELAKSGE